MGHVVNDVEKDLKDDIKAAKKIQLSWPSKLLLMFAALPAIWLFDHFGHFNSALPAMDCTGVLAFFLVLKWGLRRRAWFWITLVFLAGIHILVIALIPWTNKWIPAAAWAFAMSLDLCLMFVVVDVVERLMDGPGTSKRPAKADS